MEGGASIMYSEDIKTKERARKIINGIKKAPFKVIKIGGRAFQYSDEVYRAAKKEAEEKEIISKTSNAAKKAASQAAYAAAKATEASVTATAKMTEATERLAYAAPSPVQVFAMAFQKMGRTMKLVLSIIFSVIILFVPWGIFYYAGWALGAAIMFLLSAIYWVFINVFNGIAYIAVSIINAFVSIIIRLIKAAVEAIFTIFGGGTWTAGDYLLNKALIKYSEIAQAPKLMKPIPPKWEPWMAQSVLTKLLEITGLKEMTKWFATYYEITGKMVAQSLYNMPPSYLVLIFVFIPAVLVIAIIVYLRRRSAVYA